MYVFFIGIWKIFSHNSIADRIFWPFLSTVPLQYVSKGLFSQAMANCVTTKSASSQCLLLYVPVSSKAINFRMGKLSFGNMLQAYCAQKGLYYFAEPLPCIHTCTCRLLWKQAIVLNYCISFSPSFFSQGSFQTRQIK